MSGLSTVGPGVARRGLLAGSLATVALAGTRHARVSSYPIRRSTNVTRTIVCLGNSTTWNGRPDNTDWPLLATQRSVGALRLINAGVPRDTVPMMGARWADDVAVHAPSAVIICGGTVELQSPGASVVGVMRNVQRIAAVALSQGITPIIAAVPPLGRPPGSSRSHHALAVSLNNQLGMWAAQSRLQVLNFHTPLADWYGEPRREFFGLTYSGGFLDSDGSRQFDDVHPDVAGRSVMADVAVRALT